jgi:Rhodopirellula transposase DDE domain
MEPGGASVIWAYQPELGGQPLSSWEKLLGYIRDTTNKSGLKVSAERIRGNFERGQSLSVEQKAALRVQAEAVNPLWSYTIAPGGFGYPDRLGLSKTGT